MTQGECSGTKARSKLRVLCHALHSHVPNPLDWKIEINYEKGLTSQNGGYQMILVLPRGRCNCGRLLPPNISRIPEMELALFFGDFSMLIFSSWTYLLTSTLAPLEPVLTNGTNISATITTSYLIVLKNSSFCYFVVES